MSREQLERETRERSDRGRDYYDNAAYDAAQTKKKVIGALAVLAFLFLAYLYLSPATPATTVIVTPAAPNIPVGTTGDPSKGTGTGLVVGGGSGAGGVGGGTGTGGVGGGGGGANVFTPPGDDPKSDPTTDPTPASDGATEGSSTATPTPVPVNKIKMARLYAATDYAGDDKPLLPGMSTILATVSGGKYVFKWKSMKIEVGTKIMFSRSTGGGNTRHSFAVGQFNVDDLEDWVRSYDRISGTGNWGYGSLTIDRLGTYQSNPIYIKILNDPEWLGEIKKEQAGCVHLMRAWGGASKGYPDSTCDSVNKNTFGGVYTISM